MADLLTLLVHYFIVQEQQFHLAFKVKLNEVEDTVKMVFLHYVFKCT